MSSLSRDIPSKLGVLQDECYGVKIQVNQTEVNRPSVPVLWDTFISFVVDEVPFFSRYCKNALDNLLS